MTLAIRGAASRIAETLLPMLPAGERVVNVGRGEPIPLNADRYLFCAGVLFGQATPTPLEIADTFDVNFFAVRRACEAIFDANDAARVCVIGSESAIAGSYDMAYAASKRCLHDYVERKQLRTSQQQLVCVAPSIVEDCEMTTGRKDRDVLARKRAAHPKRRFLRAEEVARLVRFALYEDDGYLSGVVLRMNGGAHTCTR